MDMPVVARLVTNSPHERSMNAVAATISGPGVTVNVQTDPADVQAVLLGRAGRAPHVLWSYHTLTLSLWPGSDSETQMR